MDRALPEKNYDNTDGVKSGGEMQTVQRPGCLEPDPNFDTNSIVLLGKASAHPAQQAGQIQR